MILFDIIFEIIERIMPNSFSPERSWWREIAGGVLLLLLLAAAIYFVFYF